MLATDSVYHVKLLHNVTGHNDGGVPPVLEGPGSQQQCVLHEHGRQMSCMYIHREAGATPEYMYVGR